MSKRPPKGKLTPSLRESIMQLKVQKMLEGIVVDLSDYRNSMQKRHVSSILVVDHDEVSRNGVKRYLESEGFLVETADDAISLSSVLETQVIDLIFLDVDLPWVSGFELCSLLKSHPDLGSIPLVLTNSNKSKSLMEQGFESGCDHYIVKPYGVEIMAEVVQQVFGVY